MTRVILPAVSTAVSSVTARTSRWTAARRSTAFDAVLAAAVSAWSARPIALGPGLLDSRSSNGIEWRHTALIRAVAIVCGLALLFRRRAPYQVALVNAAASILWLPLALPFAAYALAVYDRRRRTWGWAVLAVPVTVGAVLSAYLSEHVNWIDVLGGTLAILASTVVAPLLLGLYLGSRRRLVQALAERAERAEAEQDLRAEQARLAERARIAGEMHDVVTHRVSLMVLQASSLRTRATDEQTRQAAEEMRLTGRQALQELRDLVGVLRSEDQIGSGLDDEHAVLDVTALVDDSRTAGVAAELVTEGAPTPSALAVRRAAYRVVQEGLTNVHKHAPGSRVDIRVHYTGDRMRVSVRNTAATRRPDVELGAGGTGLAGLRQRVDLVGGTLAAGPDADGGFELTADLPADGADRPTGGTQ